MKATHTNLHMSPAQAAQVANVSRWTIMRAIKSQDLLAIRDNRNQWKIAAKDLDLWRAHSVRAPDGMHTRDTETELREKLAAETARASAAEALLVRERDALASAEIERDRWRAMAEKLAERPRSWWPWKRT